MSPDEFRKRYPVLVHYSPSMSFGVDDGLLTASQILDRCADAAGLVSARFQTEPEFTAYSADHWKIRSRFKRGAGEVGSNLAVRDCSDHSRIFILGNNYPLGDGTCLGTTIPLTDNRAPGGLITREEWFSTLNDMFWVFGPDDVNEGVLRHLRAAAGERPLTRVSIQTRALSDEFLQTRIRLSAINGGGSNGALARGTATYRALSEWNGAKPVREIGVVKGFSPADVQLLKSVGALALTQERPLEVAAEHYPAQGQSGSPQEVFNWSPTPTESPFLRWYGERGVVNALVGHCAADPAARVPALLEAIRWANGDSLGWLPHVRRSTCLVEWGLADFGNPDLIIVCDTADGPRCVFIEAKVGQYISSMMPNARGMAEPGFNSSINGQIALKYRFALALQRARSDASMVEEEATVLQQYRNHLADRRSQPRRLAKPAIVEMLGTLGLLGLPEERCSYVALTWDSANRIYWSDAWVKDRDGLPRLIGRQDAIDSESPSGRLGWLGYQELADALELGSNIEFGAAWSTMQGKLQPDINDYGVAEAAFDSAISPESLADASHFRDLFPGYQIEQNKGSYSVKDGGQTIAKIIPRRDLVFFGDSGVQKSPCLVPGIT